MPKKTQQQTSASSVPLNKLFKPQYNGLRKVQEAKKLKQQHNKTIRSGYRRTLSKMGLQPSFDDTMNTKIAAAAAKPTSKKSMPSPNATAVQIKMHKAQQEFEQQQQELAKQRAEKEQSIKQQKHKIRQRFEKKAKLNKKTSKGQPLMKYKIQDLLEKAQQIVKSWFIQQVVKYADPCAFACRLLWLRFFIMLLLLCCCLLACCCCIAR